MTIVDPDIVVQSHERPLSLQNPATSNNIKPQSISLQHESIIAEELPAFDQWNVYQKTKQSHAEKIARDRTYRETSKQHSSFFHPVKPFTIAYEQRGHVSPVLPEISTSSLHK